MARGLHHVHTAAILQLAASVGQWRRCADKYLEAYMVADSGWVAKYNCWSGYTSVLREDHFPASE